MQAEQYELHGDIEERHWWFRGRRRIMRQLLGRILPPSPDALVVDVGCGTGGNIAALTSAYSCVGIDHSPQAIALAQSRFSGVRFLCGSAPEDLDPWMGRVGAVLLMDVLEHLPDDFAVLSRLLAALPSGAHILLTVPADRSLWSPHDVSFGHYRRYDKERLARVWEGLPVTARLLSYFNARLYPVVKCVRTVNRWRRHTGGLAGTDFRMPAPRVNRLLEAIFAAEGRVLVGALDNPGRPGFRRGVSLVAVLRREAGRVTVRSKPDDLPPDLHDPGRAGAPSPKPSP